MIRENIDKLLINRNEGEFNVEMRILLERSLDSEYRFE